MSTEAIAKSYPVVKKDGSTGFQPAYEIREHEGDRSVVKQRAVGDKIYPTKEEADKVALRNLKP